jgi:hypothetical protein
MGLNLREFLKPLEPVTFPNGVTHQPTPFGTAEYQLWREAIHLTDGERIGQLMLQIIRACYPTVTDDDLLDCNWEMLLALASYPGEKIDQARTIIKNVAAVARETTPVPPESNTPSSPETSGSTSSPKSRKRSAKTGGASTTALHT